MKDQGPRAASKDKRKPIISLPAQCYRTVPAYCLLLALTSHVYYVSFLANSRSSKLRSWEIRNTEYISTVLHENKTAISATMRLTACACILLKDGVFSSYFKQQAQSMVKMMRFVCACSLPSPHSYALSLLHFPTFELERP